MLTLEGVSYRYAGATRPSLRDVSLTFADGEVVGVAGRSEAGKTTLCLVLSGLAPRTVGGTLTGRLLLDGADAAPLSIHQLAERIGIAFASPATQLSGVAATVYEEVAFGPMNLGLPRPEIIQNVSPSSPHDAISPGRKLSNTTSARSPSVRASARSPSSVRSSATERLLRFNPR